CREPGRLAAHPPYVSGGPRLPHREPARAGERPRSARGGPVRDLAGRVIGATHERAGLDVPEAELAGLDLQHGELIRGDIARNWQVVGARPQVLSDRQDLDVVRPQVAEELDHLIDLLTQAEPDSRVRESTR